MSYRWPQWLEQGSGAQQIDPPPLESGSPTDIALGLPVGIDWLGAGLLCYAMLGSGGGSVIWERWYALLEARSGRRRRFDGVGGEEIARRPA